MFPDVDEQLKVIERGTVDIFPRDELIEKLERSRETGRPLNVKLGLDPTVADIHLGNALPLRKLRQFQDLGHHAVVIIGDFTAMVGDPSGQDKTRPQLTHEEVMENARTYMEQVGKILNLEEGEIVYNGDWFFKMTFQEVVQLASQTTVARVLERDDFAKRYKAGDPIALHELLYPLMQGHDSVVVKSDVEIGGNDQTFNLLVGRDMQRDTGLEPQVAITLPMLVGTDGVKKMSKSLGNYIGISEAPEDMYGKAMSIPDRLLRSYFVLTTDVPMDEVEAMLAPERNPMDAKMSLAKWLVRCYHGPKAAEKAEEHFERTVRRRELPDEIPEHPLPAAGETSIVELIMHCKLAQSKREARRLVAQGGVSIDGARIDDPDATVSVSSGSVLRAGKRKFARLV